ncbi:FAD/NAD(P)-binding protein [Legionella drozanskii]|uniref:FAD-dependent urate hydroxylase HpyO/Asp monooxygenase CreE-like FAD/NAD(P)-binding domain-containing protein n=1 Tax=Legionella drozanskii LLAP-1 TaxID=1212489 RepID=A0A0W0SWL0_9GAMM|nr:FAD/NAD(P)-binding protein [Legionella drozanskii]KTC87683.1 hypothetical protein Ldro_1302 [Legionella drozanskii LLAP-1]
MMIKIAIIGGGPASVSLCIELKNQLADLNIGIEILVFEKNSHIGHGLPYGGQEESYLLNLPKEIMEPVSGESNQFVQWLIEHDLNDESQFPSRYLFGQYLEYRAIRAQIEAESQGLTIQYLINHEVLDVKATDEGTFQVISSREDYDVHYVVLSPGHMPSTAFAELNGQKGYVHNPIESQYFKVIDQDEPVTIIGSRLTAIDVALKLKRMNHRGKLTMMSRSGLLPTVLGKTIPPYSLKYMTLEGLTKKANGSSLNLKDLNQLFWQELEELGDIGHLKAFPKSAHDISALDWITHEINEAEEGARPWQQFLFALYPLTPHLWTLLNCRDQTLFMAEFYSLFITYLAAFPLENAYKIKELLRQQQLTVLGGLKEISLENSQFLAHCQNGQTIKSNWLINATGPSYEASTLPLLQKMLESGLIAQHPLGGIQIEKETLKVVNNQRQTMNHLYVVGELTKGSFFLTTDLGCVTAQTRKIASRLADELKVSMPQTLTEN